MMQYLTSILFKNRSSKNKNNKNSDKELQDLEARLAVVEKNQQEIIVCIQHLASSISAVVMHTADQKKDPLDEILDSLPNDDNGSGYLH